MINDCPFLTRRKEEERTSHVDGLSNACESMKEESTRHQLFLRDATYTEEV